MRYELTGDKWTAIKPMLPIKPRSIARLNDRRVLNGIYWVLRSGAPWRDLPESLGPYSTCYDRFIRGELSGLHSVDQLRRETMTPRKLLMTICAVGALGLASHALAHSAKKTTTPADGAVQKATPETIAMTFDSPMRLTMIRLIDADGTEFEARPARWSLAPTPSNGVDSPPAAQDSKVSFGSLADIGLGDP